MGDRRLGPTQQLIVDDLEANGPVHSSTGAATRVLAERMGWTGSLQSLAQCLKGMEQAGRIERVMKAKSTLRIGLPQQAAAPGSPAHRTEAGCDFCRRRADGSKCAIHRAAPEGPTEISADKACRDAGTPRAAGSPEEPILDLRDEPILDLRDMAPDGPKPVPGSRDPGAGKVSNKLDKAARPPVPGARTPGTVDLEVVGALGEVLLAAAERTRAEREEFVELQTRYATLVDELAERTAALLAAHEKIGRLERANELLGQRLARTTRAG